MRNVSELRHEIRANNYTSCKFFRSLIKFQTRTAQIIQKSQKFFIKITKCQHLNTFEIYSLTCDEMNSRNSSLIVGGRTPTGIKRGAPLLYKAKMSRETRDQIERMLQPRAPILLLQRFGPPGAVKTLRLGERSVVIYCV